MLYSLVMKISIMDSGMHLSCDLSQGIPISIPLSAEGPRCFNAPCVQIRPFSSNDFVGEIKQGSSVNFFNVSFNPHGNGTHTECLGHISREHQSLPEVLKEHHFMAALLSVKPASLENGDLVIPPELLHLSFPLDIEALIIRTLPNNASKGSKDYSGTNPPYLLPETMEKLVKLGVNHLLVDLPSVDREEDEGRLNGHRIFWAEGRERCTITELIYVPPEVKDGLYLLNLQVTSLKLDASPSNPVIYPLKQNEKSI